MGLGKDFEKGLGIMHQPVFAPDQDWLIWRKKIASWVDLIAKVASKGNDNFYKTVFCTFGRHLYDRGLRQAQQSLVDEAQEQGKIDYKQEDQVTAHLRFEIILSNLLLFQTSSIPHATTHA